MADNKELCRLTRNSAKILDKNIVLLDYKNHYDLDGLMKKGVSNIAELIAHVVKFSSMYFTNFSPLFSAEYHVRNVPFGLSVVLRLIGTSPIFTL